MNAVQKLRQLHGELAKGPASAMQAWPTIARLLSRMPLDQDKVKKVCDQRDPLGLDVLITELEHPPSTQTGPNADAVAQSESSAKSVSSEQKKAAMRAFRKRLKLARLADESKLGGRYVSGGHHSQIDAIIPPDTFPPVVWKALADEGQLIYTGQGFYALPG